ncbi:FeoA domain-containing protein [Methanothermobacter wolfeii]|uniref:FeoA domain-containing protein n=1 Tax=Methanothermobacter wolfeii TaxID=145261 RepID=A0A9E7UN17_METWO|nr:MULTISPECIES: FeoA domain-containing protein [Methanothermobacter]MDI6702631.1 FeoA domain-containing protein [Methanothermobacter wolfeii]MDI6841848.1 FeoA domain-containing protein [Methanothermobacter wolfeii]NLM03113.1 iron transporter [Methanothermobacter wolfeii]QHN07052.1 iron transporter [Methanothermobacter sp. THM-1]UXH31657.1 FeoA domain-containing protein [Methanothermobacter wolfeii]
METTLDRINESERVRVSSVELRGHMKQRIILMGITEGADILVERIAPLGDPMKVRVRGHPFSLRRAEASQIRVRRMKDAP